MNEISFQDSPSGRLAEILTELLTRLRLSSSLDSGRLVLPPFLTRLETASRLLAHAGTRENYPGFQRLGSVLPEFISFVEENPGRYPLELDRPLEILADHLETLLAEIDKGESTASVGEDSRWGEIHSRFESAGTAPAVMEDLEQALDRWETGDGSAGRVPWDAEELRRRWASLRRRGDRLFEKPILTAPPVSEGLLTIQGQNAVCGLLLDSPFQRDQLLQKIRLTGSRAVVLDCPEQAVELALEGSLGLVLLGDNLEPTRNLEKILAVLRTERLGTPESPTCCILVSGSRPGCDERNRRAVALGAAGNWAPPFETTDLQKILDLAAR